MALQEQVGLIAAQVVEVQMQQVSCEFSLREQIFYRIASGDKYSPATEVRQQFLQQVEQSLVADRLIVVLHALQVIDDEEKRPSRVEGVNSLFNFCFCTPFRIWQNLF